MLCENCNEREARVFVRQLIGAQSVEMHLCEVCAREKGIGVVDGGPDLSLATLLRGLVDSGAQPLEESKSCPRCGLSLSQLKKDGRLGCADCATVFAQEIGQLLARQGSKPEHRGKLPLAATAARGEAGNPTAGNPAANAEAERSLRERLRRAIEVEDYEAAARLRDELRALSQGSA
jgi:protein arginine kinase activator